MFLLKKIWMFQKFTIRYHERQKVIMKEARINLVNDEKKQFEKAATLLQMNLHDFLKQAAHFYAKKAFEEFDQILLSKEDANLVIDAINNPPKPNQNLKKALKRYQQN